MSLRIRLPEREVCHYLVVEWGALREHLDPGIKHWYNNDVKEAHLGRLPE
uniref:Uncharacterized protein n=1 Tax=Tetraselmis sp. GSL018 TaxID=582737 RepID=A0A061RCI1_9CHLO